ncbi:CpaF family protein [Adlercreutzia murintestinalis]|uniref:CpaF family protein n=1 Tax=Adlercreutzia murintestinalis TaxID=2941325 RepID=UPI00203A73C1|nr:CpaF family protein [Adlercreutzia murintestinalis]
MSLMERVRAVADVNDAAANGSAPRKLTVEQLREDVRAWASFEAIAAIMVDNPQRARNELRTACRHALADPKWDVLSGAEKRRLIEEMIDVVFGMGPVESLIADETVTEIMVNGAQSIFYERDGCLHQSEAHFDSDEQVRVLIDRIIGPLGRRIDESSPMVDARLPQGHRVNAVIPPIAPDGPHVTIRAFARRLMTLQEMERTGSFGAEMTTFLKWLVVCRKNVVVSGGTGSGKTTLLNALSCCIPSGERIVTIEDSAELRFDAGLHVVRLEARPRNAEGEGEVTIRDLVINALRMRPDRIIVGECRSGEALDMLQAMNTGHDGSLTTLHANAPEDVIDRMVTMVRYAVDLPVDAIEAQIGNAFDYVVQVSRHADGSRFLSVIAEVEYDRTTRGCSIERVYVAPAPSEGSWVRRPALLEAVRAGDHATEREVEAWEQQAYGE